MGERHLRGSERKRRAERMPRGERVDVSVQCDGRELVQRNGKNLGIQHGKLESEKLARGEKTKTEVDGGGATMALCPAANYAMVKLLGDLFVVLDQSPELWAQVDGGDMKPKFIRSLALMDKIFMNPQQMDEIVKGAGTKPMATGKDSAELKTVTDVVRGHDEPEVKKVGQTLGNAISSTYLLKLEDLINIQFTLGRKLRMSRQVIAALFAKLVKAQKMREEDAEELLDILGGESTNLLYVAPVVLPKMTVVDGDMISRSIAGTGEQSRADRTNRTPWEKELDRLMAGGPKSIVQWRGEKKEIDAKAPPAMALAEYVAANMKGSTIRSQIDNAKPDYAPLARGIENKPGSPVKIKALETLKDAMAKGRQLTGKELEGLMPVVVANEEMPRAQLEIWLSRLFEQNLLNMEQIRKVYTEGTDAGKRPNASLAKVFKSLQAIKILSGAVGGNTNVSVMHMP